MKSEFQIADCLTTYEIAPRGILHVGAGFLEEAELYRQIGFPVVVWVEALPDTEGKRKELAAQYGHTFISVALDSKVRDSIDFHVTSNGYSSSLLALEKHATLYPEITESQVIQVPAITGMRLLEEHPEARECNVLSVDVQGAELRVLRGFDSLAQFDAILSEVYVDDVYHGCGMLRDVDALLYDHGFLRMETWIKPHEGWGDAFWVKRSLL